jgi:hypothetical protein
MVIVISYCSIRAGVVKLVYTKDLKSFDCKVVRVRVPPSASFLDFGKAVVPLLI